MTVKELKNALKGISEPIDRIAGFCDNYEQMFEACSIEVETDFENSVTTVTIDGGFSVNSEEFIRVSEVIPQLLDLPDELDDCCVYYAGHDNKGESSGGIREIRKVTLINSPLGNGVSLRGPHSCNLLDDDLYLTMIYVNDKGALSLKESFDDLLKKLDVTRNNEMFFFSERDNLFRCEHDGVYIRIISNEITSSALITLLYNSFNDVFFCQTPLVGNDDAVDRLTNDIDHRYWAKYAIVVAPADDRDSIISFRNGWDRSIENLYFFRKECETQQEVDQFIAVHKPDLEVGDRVVRFINRYIDNPLDLILDY